MSDQEPKSKKLPQIRWRTPIAAAMVDPHIKPTIFDYWDAHRLAVRKIAISPNPFGESVRLWHAIDKAGTESPEAEAYCDESDPHWRMLSQDERQAMQAYCGEQS